MEKRLRLTAALCAVIGISLFIIPVTALRRGEETEVTTDDVCLTPGCIHAASTVLKYIDSTVNPCDDFYQFACGNFMEHTVIPEDKADIGTFSTIGDTLLEKMKLLTEGPVKENELKPFQLLKTLYKTCMNTSLIEQDGLKTILAILKELGGWPVLEGDNWNEDNFDWRYCAYKYRKLGYGMDDFFDLSIGADDKNTTRRILWLDQVSLGLSREFLIKGFSDKIVKAYYDYMVDIAVLFGANKERAKREMDDTLSFVIELANISLPSEKRRNKTALYNPMTVNELQTKFPYIEWLEYINAILAPEATVTNEEIIIVAVPKFFADLEVLMKKIPKRVQANHVMWRVVASSISFLTEDLRKRQLEFHSILTGRTQKTARWKECVSISSGSLHLAAGALYVRKYFNKKAKDNILEMVKDIRDEFEVILTNVEWMDEKTRENALDKAKSITPHVAYPDELLDDRKIEEFYRKLELDENHYLQSVVNLKLFDAKFSLRRLRQPINKTEWITHAIPTVVNAFYVPWENSIQLPAGVLQGILFDANRPHYMNYGAIGFVIGHEITHGFDDQGRQIDKNGDSVDWWAPETGKAFVEKAKCIIDQYGNYTVPNLNISLNGINTQGENIADNGGIKEAYLAYNRWIQRHGTEKMLPGLKYTPNQMFWISAAHTNCMKIKPELLKLIVLVDSHSPGYFRVIGPFSNSKYFAKDFSCPLGSRMNPEKKCDVW